MSADDNKPMKNTQHACKELKKLQQPNTWNDTLCRNNAFTEVPLWYGITRILCDLAYWCTVYCITTASLSYNPRISNLLIIPKIIFHSAKPLCEEFLRENCQFQSGPASVQPSWNMQKHFYKLCWLISKAQVMIRLHRMMRRLTWASCPFLKPEPFFMVELIFKFGDFGIKTSSDHLRCKELSSQAKYTLSP